MFKRQTKLACSVLGLTLILISLGVAADPSLIGWWTFDEGSGTVANDASGRGHNGTLRGGPTWVIGRVDGALLFDGKDDYVSVGSVGITGAVDRTVMAWVKAGITAIPDKTSIFGFVPDGNVEGTYFDVEVDDKGNYVAHICGYQWIIGPVDTEWRHLAGTYEAGTGRWFLDGRHIDSAEGDIGTIDQVRIGARLSSGRYFPGLVDDVRIYNRALTEAEIQSVMAGTDLGQATEPSPADGARDVPRDAVLSWTPDVSAVRHNVYLGTSWDDVRAANIGDPRGVLVGPGQAAATFDPEGLFAFDQTYYWRVDGVGAAPANTIFKGRVWSFVSESFAYPIENIVATASHADVDAGPEKTVDGSGVNAQDQHSLNSRDMWLASPGPDEAVWIQYRFDRVYKLHQMLVWNYNGEFEPLLGFGLRTVTVEYSVDGMDWITLGDVEFAQATASAAYVYNTTVDFQGVAARFVRLTVRSGYGLVGRYGLSEVRFLYIPAQARRPQPANGATNVTIDTVLTWVSGREAVTHEVYLGTDPAALTPVGTPETASCTPDNLTFGTIYYWRVDEVNEAEAVGLWEGDLWSFTVEEYASIDDFESYNDDVDAGTTIFDTWLDGWVNNTGSTVGYLNAPFAERTIVHGGEQSMPLAYNNSVSPFYSEAERTFERAQDWTIGGADRVRLWFRGDAKNTPQTLYVTLEDSAGRSATVRSMDPDAILKTVWQEWQIPLSQFNGINLVKIEKITIGVGNRTSPAAGGTGIVYIDDVGFGRPAATP
ncbi:MAG TPA: discoidin domain-containing protein [Sedimentisphaerales bacterium]|nr:discoidin domain-containing protein [Sedimentisphaerales bacterium]HRS09461.1 discoidin domain-containing protein [Sedimentisphaerales bacterium]HRV46158.1 discoidin domain-containing protein [Sedimentisphaerales bacterium]